MYPLSDKDLDRLSREAAEQSDVDLRPSGWEQVEQRLNKELPVQKEKDRRRFLWLFFILLVAGGSGLVWMLTGKKENSITSKPNIQSAANTDNKTLTPVLTPSNPDPEANNDIKTAKEKNSTIADNNTPNTALSRNQNTSPEGSLYPENKTSGPNKVESIIRSKHKLPDSKLVADNKEKTSGAVVINKPKKSDKKQLIHHFDSDHIITQPAGIDQANATVIKPGEPDQSAKPDIQSVSTSASTRIPLTIVTPFIITNNSEKVMPSNLIAGPGIEQMTNGIAPKVQKLNAGKSGFKHPISFGILTGIDNSRIHQTGNNKPGYDIGFQVSYNFSRRWSVNTSFIFTKKNYSAEAKDFYPPKHYWTTYVQLTSLEGDCDMWDIPLNVRYNIIVKPGIKWFVNAGTSSYIMRNQAYTYYFIVNNYPAQKDWKTGSQQNEWFKIINFSAGFEKALNKSWSLQTEPFVKLPVRGLGFGKMDISSYGIMLGVKYSPAFK
jgi:hypothetical protein